MLFLFVSTRSFHNRGAFEFQVLHVAGVPCQRHYQGFWQLPLLQPARFALLPLCRGFGKLFCAKTTCLEKPKINELHSSFVIAKQSQWRSFGNAFKPMVLPSLLLIGYSENVSCDSKRSLVIPSLDITDKTVVNLKREGFTARRMRELQR